MDITPEELSACMNYLRAEPEDEAVVRECLRASREYLADGGVALPASDSLRRGRYDMAAHALALSYYDQRDPIITGSIVAENPVLRRLINQLKLTEPASKLGADSGR